MRKSGNKFWGFVPRAIVGLGLALVVSAGAYAAPACYEYGGYVTGCLDQTNNERYPDSPEDFGGGGSGGGNTPTIECERPGGLYNVEFEDMDGCEDTRLASRCTNSGGNDIYFLTCSGDCESDYIPENFTFTDSNGFTIAYRVCSPYCDVYPTAEQCSGSDPEPDDPIVIETPCTTNCPEAAAYPDTWVAATTNTNSRKYADLTYMQVKCVASDNGVMLMPRERYCQWRCRSGYYLSHILNGLYNYPACEPCPDADDVPYVYSNSGNIDSLGGVINSSLGGGAATDELPANVCYISNGSLFNDDKGGGYYQDDCYYSI